MSNFVKITSWITVISVIAMVVLGILCPQMSLAKDSLDHSSCSGSLNMSHLSAEDSHSGCINAHLKAIADLPGIMPDTLLFALTLLAVLVIFSLQKSLNLLTLIFRFTRSRWRFTLYLFETSIKPLFCGTFLAWLNLVSRSSIAVQA